ncbi:DUF4124 domain-containing protein [Thermodesulfobacteriota bacterium]
MVTRIFLAILIVFLCDANICADEVYTWIDEDGLTHITDRPPNKKYKIIDKNKYTPLTPEELKAHSERRKERKEEIKRQNIEEEIKLQNSQRLWENLKSAEREVVNLESLCRKRASQVKQVQNEIYQAQNEIRAAEREAEELKLKYRYSRKGSRKVVTVRIPKVIVDRIDMAKNRVEVAKNRLMHAKEDAMECQERLRLSEEQLYQTKEDYYRAKRLLKLE